MPEKHVKPWMEDSEPVHMWFGLSYSAYLVLPRSALQSMPAEWQRKFLGLVEELNGAFGHLAADGSYEVNMEYGSDDPLKDYERGRRRLWRKDEG